MSHWIIVPVILPALVAALMLLALRDRLMAQRILSLVAVLSLNGVALGLVAAVSASGPEAYFLGDWPAPFGIVLVLDRLSALMLALLAGLALSVVVYAIGSGWDARGAHFHPLLQFLLMGIGGAFLTGDAFNLFVFFEVMLIASYGLMIHGGGAERTRAGIQYVGFNLFGSALFLVALGLLYAVTGTLNLADLAQKLPDLPKEDAALLRVAAVLLLAVFAIKAALVPLQFWLPGTYAQTPGVVAAMFAVMTKVGVYAILRFTTLVFPPDIQATGLLLSAFLLPAGLATLGLGAIGVLGASTLPRLAAFAGMASTGTIIIALAHQSDGATAAGLYYVVHSTLATALMFLVVDLIDRRRAHLRLDHDTAPMSGSGLVGVFFMLAALSLAGMPPLSGFVGKLLVLDSWRDHMLQVWGAILVTSLLLVIGLSRAGSLLFWKPLAEPAPPHRGPERLALVAVAGLVALIVGLTVFAGPVHDWLLLAAEDLHRPWAYVQANRLGAGG